MSLLSIFTSTTANGNLSYKWGTSDEVQTNRQKFLKSVGLDLKQTVALKTQDSTQIALVTLSDVGKGMLNLKTGIPADALITQTLALPLFLLTADCLPLVLFDSQMQTLALVHLSLKTLDAGLPTKVIDHLIRQYHCQPQNIQAYIGPGIHQGSYLLKNPAQKNKPEWQPYIVQTPNKMWAIDLHGYVLFQLLQAGIGKANINLDPTNTFTSPEYFSHARSIQSHQPEGRFATVAVMN